MNEDHQPLSLRAMLAGCAVTAGWVVAACWLRARYVAITPEGSAAGASSAWLAGGLAALSAVLSVWGQRFVAGRGPGLIPALAIAIVLAGMIASFGLSVVDGLSALLLVALLNGALGLSGRWQLHGCAAAILVVAALDAVVWKAGLLDVGRMELDRVSYATQWRYAAALLDVSVIAFLLGGLGAVRCGRLPPAAKGMAACLAGELVVIACVPALFGSFPLSFLIPAFLLGGEGWRALGELWRAEVRGIRGLAAVLVVVLGLWTWAPVRAFGRTLVVALFF